MAQASRSTDHSSALRTLPMPNSNSSIQAWQRQQDNDSGPPSLPRETEESEVPPNQSIQTVLSAHSEQLDRFLATQWQRLDKAMVASRERFEMWIEERCNQVEATLQNLVQEAVINVTGGDSGRLGVKCTELTEKCKSGFHESQFGKLSQEISALREDVRTLRLEVDGFSAWLDLQENKPPPPSSAGTVAFFNALSSEGEDVANLQAGNLDALMQRKKFEDCWEDKSKAFTMLELIVQRQMEHEHECGLKFASITKELANHYREMRRQRLEILPVAGHRGNLPVHSIQSDPRTVDDAARVAVGESSVDFGRLLPLAGHRGNLPVHSIQSDPRTVDDAARGAVGEAYVDFGRRDSPPLEATRVEGQQQSDTQELTFFLDMRQGGPLGVLLEPCPNNVNLNVKEVKEGSLAHSWVRSGDVIIAVSNVTGAENMMDSLRNHALHKITILSQAAKTS